jgi:hypothetical protein
MRHRRRLIGDPDPAVARGKVTSGNLGDPDFGQHFRMRLFNPLISRVRRFGAQSMGRFVLVTSYPAWCVPTSCHDITPAT